jgi:AcrR family transcriptional regulator
MSIAVAAAVSSPATGTALRLLDAAERIFAEQGIEAASVRAITQAAGANVAAVSYHFGSKQDLVAALLERRVNEMHDARRPLLDAALAAPHVSARDLATVWVRPLAELAVDPDRGAYLGFLAVMQAAGPGWRDLTVEVFRRQQVDFGVLLERALPQLTGPERWFRLTLAIDATIRVLADIDRASQPWRSSGGIESDALVAQLVDAVTSLLTPVTPVTHA